MTTLTSLARASFSIALLSSAALAQAGPPVAASARAPRDTQPTLMRPKAPSPPPSAVAPRASLSRPTPAGDPVVLKAPGRTGLPPDSVRPKAPAISMPDPSRAPAQRIDNPPRPAAASIPAVVERASVRADVPPLDATARCKDGTWLTGQVTTSSCERNGGLAVRMPQKSTPRRPTP